MTPAEFSRYVQAHDAYLHEVCVGKEAREKAARQAAIEARWQAALRTSKGPSLAGGLAISAMALCGMVAIGCFWALVLAALLTVVL